MKVGRNETCPCGSGIKYKKCCNLKEEKSTEIVESVKEKPIMSEDRTAEVKKEAERRLGEWIDNSTFDYMTVNGSFIRFNMGLGLNGYPLQKEEWMEGKGFDKFFVDDEFDSEEYDNVLSELFVSAQEENYLVSVWEGNGHTINKEERLLIRENSDYLKKCNKEGLSAYEAIVSLFKK